MEMSYAGALVMPKSYALMTEEEMQYLEGGKNISYNLAYATTAGAMGKAISYKISNKWWKISSYDLAAEIFFHAYAYYYGSALLGICSMLGYSASSIRNSNFWSSLKDGIGVKNGLDTKKEFGVPRYVIFRAVYSYARGVM
ncbi:MAG: hypothetical protein IJA36_04180 [Lachnospiraceae bacterium]|nr:hypothetical protein [Lachnospiraceae bacterium]